MARWCAARRPGIRRLTEVFAAEQGFRLAAPRARVIRSCGRHCTVTQHAEYLRPAATVISEVFGRRLALDELLELRGPRSTTVGPGASRLADGQPDLALHGDLRPVGRRAGHLVRDISVSTGVAAPCRAHRRRKGEPVIRSLTRVTAGL